MNNIWNFIKPFIMSDSDVSNAFTVVIILVGVIGFCFRMVKKRNNFVLIFPSIAISLGILGTFTGIYIGLIGFDVSNISASVPQLLEGLKTAFTTSILGMSVSIVLRIVYEIKDIFEDDKREIDDPVPLLQEITKGIENLGVSSKEIERAIVACFRSEEEYSLLSQLKLMRQEITDTRRETIKSFESFAEKFSEMGTKALVKALENVINDFNVLLNELVSDSFKELSQAMIKLVDWQDNYRVHIDQMQEKTAALMAQMEASVNILNQSAEKLISIDNNLSNISISVGKISVSAEDIENHVELLKNQNAMLKEGIEGIKKIGQEAEKVIPTLNSQLGEITNKLSQTVSTCCNKLEEFNKKIKDTVEDSTREIDQAVKKLIEDVEKAVREIDKGLEQELTKALSSLIGALAALSGKFVADYNPLTDRLREVVRLSEKIEKDRIGELKNVK